VLEPIIENDRKVKLKKGVARPVTRQHVSLVLMSEFPVKLFGFGLILAGLLRPFAVSACDVPVFRYALERWNPDPYVAVVFHRATLTSDQQALVESMQKASRDRTANLVVRKADVGGAMSGPFHALWKTQGEPDLPWMVLRYPANTGIVPSTWAGPLSADIVKSLVDSPVRRQIARSLLRGDTAVWLLLESGDQKQDDTLARTLETESRKLERTLELPTPAADDPPLITDLPLKIAFSTVRVARSDPAERLLVAQLLNWEPHLINLTKAMLFPVFGRGRVLPPAVGDKIRPEVIGSMARLLTGPCTCQLKEMNAGFDLLMSAKWDALAEGREVQAPEPPPLVGLSRFAAEATNRAAAPSGNRGNRQTPEQQAPHDSSKAALALAGAGVTAELVEPDHLVRNLLAVLGLGAGLVAVATWVLKARANRTRR
jgi:hypothetical protein